VNPRVSIGRSVFFSATAIFLLALTTACGAPPPDSTGSDGLAEDVAQTSEAILSSDVIARAQAWVDAQVPYCQAVSGGWDAVCGKTCIRTGAAANPAWDPYRSDCSGFVSWAWGLPAPGLVVSGLAKSSVSTPIDAKDLQPGDALYATDKSHIILFAGWVTPYSKMHIMQEGNCDKVAEAKDYTVSSVSGSTVYFSWGTYTAARYNSISFQPPSCDRTAGGFTFSCDGEEQGLHCVNVNEPEDPETWSDNYFCSAKDLGMQWSSSGPIAGMDCTNVYEAAESQASAWSDNYLCVPKQSPYALSYSSAGPIDGKSCVQWNETADLDQSWKDNYVCSEPVHVFSNAGFAFSAAGPIDGMTCVNVDEPSDPDTWSDNYFCSDSDLGMVWSSAGPIDGMDCTLVSESAEEQADAWSDNYLCLPKSSDYAFSWSSAGPIDGKSCVRWYDHAEKSDTWLDNWLCVDEVAAPEPTSGSGGSGAGSIEPGSGASSGTAPSSQQKSRVFTDQGSGCSFTVGSRPTSLWALAFGGLALVFSRRRKASASPR
jgi:MYXO-CTERM domain-containing protein